MFPARAATNLKGVDGMRMDGFTMVCTQDFNT